MLLYKRLSEKPFSMAAQPGGTEAADASRVPVAHGGLVHRADKGLQAREAGECLLSGIISCHGRMLNPEYA